MSINSQYGAEEHGSGVYGGKRITEESARLTGSGQTVTTDTTIANDSSTTTTITSIIDEYAVHPHTTSIEFGSTIGSVGPDSLELADGAQAESATLDSDGRGILSATERTNIDEEAIIRASGDPTTAAIGISAVTTSEISIPSSVVPTSSTAWAIDSPEISNIAHFDPIPGVSSAHESVYVHGQSLTRSRETSTVSSTVHDIQASLIPKLIDLAGAMGVQSMMNEIVVHGTDRSVATDTTRTTVTKLLRLSHRALLSESGHTEFSGIPQTSDIGHAKDRPKTTISATYRLFDIGRVTPSMAIEPTLSPSALDVGVSVDRGRSTTTTSTRTNGRTIATSPTIDVSTIVTNDPVQSHSSALSSSTGTFGMIQRIVGNASSTGIGSMSSTTMFTVSSVTHADDLGQVQHSSSSTTTETSRAVDTASQTSTPTDPFRVNSNANAIDTANTVSTAQFQSSELGRATHPVKTTLTVTGQRRFSVTGLGIVSETHTVSKRSSVSSTDLAVGVDVATSSGMGRMGDRLLETTLLQERLGISELWDVSALEKINDLQSENARLVANSETVLSDPERAYTAEYSTTLGTRDVETSDIGRATIPPINVPVGSLSLFRIIETAPISVNLSTVGQSQLRSDSDTSKAIDTTQRALGKTYDVQRLTDLTRGKDTLSISIPYTLRITDSFAVSNEHARLIAQQTLSSTEIGSANSRSTTRIRSNNTAIDVSNISEPIKITADGLPTTTDRTSSVESITTTSYPDYSVSDYTSSWETPTSTRISSELHVLEFHPLFQRTFIVDLSDFSGRITNTQHLDQYVTDVRVQAHLNKVELTSSDRTVELAVTDPQSQTADVDIVTGDRTIAVQSESSD